jgi:hypothetical protein
MTSPPGNLTFEDLMTKGYFPDRVIPPVNSFGLAKALPEMLAYITPLMAGMLKKPNKSRSRCVSHSVPKRKHLRRTLSIPNPMYQCMAALEVTAEWQSIHEFCLQSPISLSIPIVGGNRAVVARDDLSKQPIFRSRACYDVGLRILKIRASMMQAKER